MPATFQLTSEQNIAQIEGTQIGAPGPQGLTGSLALSGMEFRTPAMHGAVGNGIADDGAALNAFFAYVVANRCFGYVHGNFATSVPIVLDWGTFGDETKSRIDFGRCNITALNAMTTLFTMDDGVHAHYTGELNLTGTGSGSNVNADWTVANGLVVTNHSGARMPDLFLQAFAAYGVDLAKTANNHLRWGQVYGKRIGSGRNDTVSRLGNWSARVAGDGAGLGLGWGQQYTEFTVSNLPPAYLQEVDGAFLPTHSLFLIIEGRAHQVSYLDVATSKVRVYPALKDSTGSSGTYIWMYGAVFCARGNDCNVNTFDVVSGNLVGCTFAMENLYGHSIGQLHCEGGGAGFRLGPTPNGQVFGGFINQLYVDGCIFNGVFVGPATSNFTIGAVSSTAGDITLYHNSYETKTAAERYGRSLFPVSFSDDIGVHFPHRYTSKDLPHATSTLDLNQANSLEHEVLLTNRFTDTASITLVAPADVYFYSLGYTGTKRTIVGHGAGGKPTGDITITPPAGHTINGGAVGAALVLAASTFVGPVEIAVCYEPSDLITTALLAQPNWHVRVLSGVASIQGTAVYDPPSIAAGAFADTTVTVTGAVLGDGAVAAFSLALGGLDITAWVSAANTVSVRFRNPTAAAVDLASGTLTARVLR